MLQTLQITMNVEVTPCKKCDKTPAIALVDNHGRPVYSVGCCGQSKANQFLTVAIDSWNFDMMKS